jgi:transcriptional regulator with XRE-family HTH domain
MGSYTAALVRRMERSGISRTQLAAGADVPLSQLSRWLNTAMQPTWRNMERLDRALTRLEAAVRRRKARRPGIR